MITALVLLLAWSKIQLRQAFSRVSWSWMVRDAWLTVASFAIGAGISTYFAIRFLREWQRSPEIINYLDWYLFIAVGFLSVVSLLHFTVFLSSRPDSLFLHLSPAPRWKLYIARLAYVLLFNLIFFLIISFPPLIIIELWAGGGRWGYFALLLIVGGLVSLTAALTGAILAVPTAFLVRFLPRRLQRMTIHPKMAAMTSASYLAATCYLPVLLPPILFPGWWSVARPLMTGVVHWAHPALVSGGVLCLLGLFLLVYTAVAKVAPFEERAAAKRPPVEVVRFRRFPLIQRRLATGWWVVVLLSVGSGIGFAIILPGSVEMPMSMRIAILVGIISMVFIDLIELLSDSGLLTGKAFFLVKAAPNALSPVVRRSLLTLYLQVTVVCIIAVSIYALFLHQAGDLWVEAFLFLPVLLPSLAFPVTSTVFIVRLATLNPSRRASFLEACIHLVADFSAYLLSFFAVGYFLFPYPPLFSPAVLAWRTAAFFAVCMVGACLLLCLAVRRLARIEWM